MDSTRITQKPPHDPTLAIRVPTKRIFQERPGMFSATFAAPGKTDKKYWLPQGR